jgi:hypothetical protein
LARVVENVAPPTSAVVVHAVAAGIGAEGADCEGCKVREIRAWSPDNALRRRRLA